MNKEQLAERKTGIGATDIAAVFCRSPWKTPLKLWEEKVSPNDNEATESSLRLELGKYLEPFLLRAYTNKMGGSATLVPDLFRHPQYHFLISHVDAVSSSNRLIEFKTALFMRKSEWGDEFTDEMPDHYFLQCAHEALVYSAATNCHIEGVDLVVFTGFDLKLYKYERNSEVEEAIIQEADQFWHLIEARIPPQASTYQEVSQKYKKDIAGGFIVADEKISLSYYQFLEIKKQLKELQLQEDICKTAIGEALGDNQVLINNEGNELLTWKSQNTTRVDIEKLKSMYPDIYKDCLNKSSSRVMRTKESK